MRSTSDAAASMLEEFVGRASVRVSVHLHCGNGRVALAAAAAGGTEWWCADRRYPSVIAARRLLESNATGTSHILHAHGAHEFAPDLAADLVTIRIPTERIAVQQLVWDAFHLLREGGRCMLAGGSNEGVKPAVRLLESLFGASTVEAQHSGHRLVVATKRQPTPTSSEGFDARWLAPDNFGELQVSVRNQEWRMFTRPGVFSWEHLDEATEILANVMDVRAGERVLDIGCGMGALGLLAAGCGASRVLMLDADAEAVRCVRHTLRQATVSVAEVRASDVASAAGDESFDVVLSNPPFHHGKQVDLATPRRFIRESWEHLVPGGRLYLVANRTLPYERIIEEQFGAVGVLHDGRRFKVLSATR